VLQASATQRGTRFWAVLKDKASLEIVLLDGIRDIRGERFSGWHSRANYGFAKPRAIYTFLFKDGLRFYRGLIEKKHQPFARLAPGIIERPSAVRVHSKMELTPSLINRHGGKAVRTGFFVSEDIEFTHVSADDST
jgi:hypothetical protein